ncbi:MAG: HAD-IA family hydrolase [Rhizobiales bacterium]|nr:HAD-IA family hydrolase [Hyphomicrobiales bacterium]
MTSLPVGLPDLDAILFDKDGTLVDYHLTWGPVNARAARLAAEGNEALAMRLLEAGGVDPESGRARPDSLLAAGNTAEIAAAFVAAGSPVRESALVTAIDALFSASVAQSVPVEQLSATLEHLSRAGLVLGIASNDNARGVRDTATLLGISHHIAFGCGYDSGFGVKPGPGMVHAFCKEIGVSPRRIAVVGDNRHDLLMGRAAGVALTVGVLTGTGTRETLARDADAIIDGIVDLPALLGF